MLDRVVMDVIRVTGKVSLVAYLAFPISVLPDNLLAFPLSHRIGYPPECVGTITVKIIGHDDNRVDSACRVPGYAAPTRDSSEQPNLRKPFQSIYYFIFIS